MRDDKFSITIGSSTDLICDCEMKNVVCKVSILNDISGCLLRKPYPDQFVFSKYENTDYVPQIATKPIDTTLYKRPAPKWNEKFIYNLELSVLLDPSSLVLFEIFDMAIYKNYRDFCPIAWGYLRVLSSQGRVINIGKPLCVQLYAYPQPFYLKSNLPFVSTSRLFSSKNLLDAHLSIVLKIEEPFQMYDVFRRSKCYYEIEKGSLSVKQMIEPSISDISSVSANESDHNAIEENVTIPVNLKAQLICGDTGASYLKFSHDGGFLCAAVKKYQHYYVEIFYSASMKVFTSFPAHHDIIYEMDFSMNNELLLTVSGDNTAKVWIVDDLPSKAMILPHTKYVYSGKFHPNNSSFVFTGCFDGIIRLWDRREGIPLKEFHGHRSRINTLVLSPNGKSLYAGDSCGVISAWSITVNNDETVKCECERIINDDEIGSASITHLAMYQSDLFLLVHTQDNIIRLFDTNAMTSIQRFTGILSKKYKMMSVFSVDGSYIVSGSENGKIRVFEIKTAKEIHIPSWKDRFSTPVTSIAWSSSLIAFSSPFENQPIIVFS